MLLYIMRHAESAPRDGLPSDVPDSWHITPAGREAAARVASVAAREFAFHPELILSSPFAVAQETVDPVREAVGGNPDTAVETAIDADASLPDFYRALAKRPQSGSVAIITHIPLIERLLPDLLGAGSAIQIPQGGIACVQFRGGLGPGKGQLIWLLPPQRWFDGKEWIPEDEA